MSKIFTRASLVLSVLGLAPSVLLVPVAKAAPTTICTAGNYSQFGSCINQLNRGSINFIQVTSMIQCNAAQVCHFTVTTPNHFKIVGAAPSGQMAGFKRTAAYGSPILTISNSAGTDSGSRGQIGNLTFDEGQNIASGAPGSVWTNQSCPGKVQCGDSLDLVNAQNIFVHSVTILESKNMGIGILGSKNITIRACTFSHAWVHGVWIGNDNNRSSGIHIENNSFLNNRSNGLMFTGKAPPSGSQFTWNTITGNYFYHNHNAAIYHVCGPSGTVPCGGSQLDLERLSYQTWIENNTFDHGIVDEDPSLVTVALVAGIELAPSNVSNVEIFHNQIHDENGGGITLDGDENGTVSNIDIRSNVFSNLGDPDITNNSTPFTQSGNCDQSNSCNFVMPTGVISTTPNPCAINPSTGKCTEQIQWSSAGYANNLSVYLGLGMLFAATDSKGGSGAAPWITCQPYLFNLYSNYTLLDSIRAGGSQSTTCTKDFMPF